jgi:hypothetical protein
MKSRAGKPITLCGASGGSFATTPVAGADAAERLPAESTASTV